MRRLSAVCDHQRMHVVVMGVAGVGKTTVGRALASELALPFLEGHAFHPPENRRKSARRLPVHDADRRPWLDALNEALRQSRSGAVLACSALTAAYRTRSARISTAFAGSSSRRHPKWSGNDSLIGSGISPV